MLCEIRRGTVQVDEADVAVVSLLRWRVWTSRTRSQSYAVARKGTQLIVMHRLLLDAPLGSFVDHINGDGLDNRRGNLRLCTNAENGRNRCGLNTNNRSGHRGVYWHPASNKWAANIRVNRKVMHLGVFADKLAAAAAYIAAADKHFGAFKGKA